MQQQAQAHPSSTPEDALDSWRVEVDQIIAAILPVHTAPVPCTSTLVIPSEDARGGAAEADFVLARTEPGVPCSSALRVGIAAAQDQAEASTAPALPAAQAALREVCEQDTLTTRTTSSRRPLPPSPCAEVRPVESGSEPNEPLMRYVAMAAREVGQVLGPGLLACAYADALAWELSLRGIKARRDVAMSASYKGESIADAFRAALVVEGMVLVDVIDRGGDDPHAEARLRTYFAQGGVPGAMQLDFDAPGGEVGVRWLRRDGGSGWPMGRG